MNIISTVVPFVLGSIQHFNKISNRLDDNDAINIVLDYFQKNIQGDISVANIAQTNICQFPLIVSSNITKDVVKKVGAILENLYANYIRIGVTNNVSLVSDGSKSAFEIIRSVHQNDDLLVGSSIGNVLNSYGNATIRYKDRYNEETKLFKLKLKFDRNISQQNLAEANSFLLTLYEDNFNRDIINGEIVSLYEAPTPSQIPAITPHEYALGLYRQIEFLGKQKKPDRKRISALIQKLKACLKVVNRLDNKKNKLFESASVFTEETNPEQTEEEMNEEVEKELVDEISDAIVKKLKDQNKKSGQEKPGKLASPSMAMVASEIKKFNNLTPTMLEIKFTFQTATGNATGERQITFGVKTIIHPIPAEEMCLYLPQVFNKRDNLFNLIKLSVGEKQFFKDIILDVDQNKEDAYSDKKSTRYFKHLLARKKAAKGVRRLGMGNFSPNATIVLSREDVDFIKIKDNIDLMNDYKAIEKIMNNYFLMHIVVVDEVSESLLVYDSYNHTWQEESYKKEPEKVQTFFMPTTRM